MSRPLHLEHHGDDRWIVASGEELVAEWQDACRIPSISGDIEASVLMADWVERRLRDIFDITRRVDVTGYGPALLATVEGHSAKRLLIYTHYDVQPAGDESAWSQPPFSAARVADAVIARGSCDDKADIVARIQSLRRWKDTWIDGKPPYTVIWLSEGAEEVGSPGLKEVLCDNYEQLAADWCLWESFIRTSDGRPEIAFGCRGLLMLQLEIQTMAHDQHPAFAPVFRSAAIELSSVIATLIDQHGNVLVKKFEDGVDQFSDEERRAGTSVMPPGAEESIDNIGPHWPGLSVDELRERLLYKPTINVSSIQAGSRDAMAVTSRATAELDIHLVPDQEPGTVLAAIRKHLESAGFGHVKVSVRHVVRPARSPIDTPLGRAAVVAAKDTMGDPVIYPLLPGAGPARLILDILGATTVSPAGTTRLASGIHAPNEHGSVSDYLDHVRFSYRLLESLAEQIAT